MSSTLPPPSWTPTTCGSRPSATKLVDVCRIVSGGTVDGVCDPAAGLRFSDGTRQDFGRIVSLNGHRTIELALKY